MEQEITTIFKCGISGIVYEMCYPSKATFLRIPILSGISLVSSVCLIPFTPVKLYRKIRKYRIKHEK
jgi:hypothetical protein